VRDEAAHFDGKNEALRRRFSPVEESFLRGQTIETVIELYGIKLLGVE